MTHRIGLLSDIHGNVTALEAVIQDARAQGVDQFWLLGDVLMPGPGTSDLFALIDDLDVPVCVRGNWDDCLLDSLAGKFDLDDPTDVYIARLAHFVEDSCSDAVTRVSNWPPSQVVKVGPLNVLICHNLPGKNYGTDLLPTAPQQNFDGIFSSVDADIAVIGHTHAQMMRYAVGERLIVNPGSVGQPLAYMSGALGTDRRAQYAILTVDESGLAEVDFRKVPYDIEAELAKAQSVELPYLDLYRESLEAGTTHQHDTELLHEINDRLGYRDAVIALVPQP